MASNRSILEKALDQYAKEGVILRWRLGTEFYGYIYIDILGDECFIIMEDVYSHVYRVIETIKTDWEDLRWIQKNQPHTLPTKEYSSNEKITKKQINDELDIIRGRVATPKGYKINPARTKWLMKKLKEVEKK